MAVPALRIPLGLDTQSFEKNIGEAKSLTASTTDFVVKEFAKMQLKSQIKLAIQSDQFKPAVQNATKFLGDQFAKVKPQIQDATQTMVRETTAAGIKVGEVFASPAIKGAFQAFTAVGIPAVTGLAQSLAPLALRAVAVYEAIHLVGDAVSAARDQIKDMIAVADKASNLNVSPQFLQLFEAESRKLKVSIEDMDGALTNAFSATKDKAPIDFSKWDTGEDRINEVEKALRIYNATLAKAAGTQLQGLVLFRDADTQDQKIQAVLQAMIQLDKIGQHAASLDLGEKMFGAQFVDKIRQGKTSAEGLLATMTDLKKSGDGIFPDELVTRAKAIDDQLRLSEERLSRSLKPSWAEIADVILTIKGYWADVVNLIAQAVELSNKLPIPSLAQIRDAAIGAASAIPVLGAVVTGARAAASLIPERPATFAERFGNLPPAQQQKPSRGAGAAPTLKPEAGADKFDSSVNSIEKRTAAITAESQALDLGTEARERAKVAAQLETVAKQANAAAGLGNNVVTEAQRKVIDQVSEAYGRATLAMQKAKVSSDIGFGKQTAFLSPEDVAIAQQLRSQYESVAESLVSVAAAGLRTNQALSGLSSSISNDLTSGLTDIATGAKTASQGFSDMAASIIKDIERMIIQLTIVGPLMRSLQGAFGGGFNLSGVGFNPIAGATGHATGGYITGPGSGRSDSIPARLSNGEYVVNAGATAKNKGLLDAINYGKGYADGGMVGPSVPDILSRSGGDSIQIINQTSQPATATASRNSNGDLQITLRDAVRGVINGDLASGQGVARSFKQFASAGSYRGS